jgi:hypothetical protein
MKTNFCGKCGKKLEESWNACPECGTPLSESPSPEKIDVNPFDRSHRDSYVPEHFDTSQIGKKYFQLNLIGFISLFFGILSSIFGFILGIFTGEYGWIILEIIFGIIAMIIGGISLSKSEINYPALGGLILGGANLILFWYIIPFMF